MKNLLRRLRRYRWKIILGAAVSTLMMTTLVTVQPVPAKAFLIVVEAIVLLMILFFGDFQSLDR